MNVFVESCFEEFSNVPALTPYLDKAKQYVCVECPKVVISYLFPKGERVLLFGSARAFFDDKLQLDLYDFNLERFEELVPRSLVKDSSKIEHVR